MKVLRLWEVLEVTGLSRASVYRLMKEGMFPLQIKLGPRSAGWICSEIMEWIQIRKDQRM